MPARPWWLLLTAAWMAPATAQVVYQYDDTPGVAVAIADNSCPAGGVSRTFTVPETFNVSAAGAVSLGIVATHTSRDHLQIRLTAPNGNTVVLADGVAADANDNYNILIADNHDPSAPLDDASNDPSSVASGTVAFRRHVQLANLTTTLFPSAGSVAGTWTLRVCDDTAGTTGAYVRARLVLLDLATTTVASQCGSTATFSWDTITTTPASALATKMPDGTFFTAGEVTFTQVTSVEAPVDGLTSFRRQGTQNGADTGYYAMIMDTSIAGGGADPYEDAVESTRLTLSPPVAGLDFQLLDIDQAGGAWEDQVQVIGFNEAGQRVPYLSTFVSGSATLSRVGDWVEADGANVANASNAGNVRIRFLDSVATVVVGYSQGNEPSSESAQQVVGIGDPSYCAFDYGDAPSSYGTTARHQLGSRSTLRLGANAPDGETAAAPGAGANGDGSDEDAVSSWPTYNAAGMTCGSFTTAPGQYCASVSVTNATSNAANIVGFFDFNGDGDFNDAGERSSPNLGGGSGGAADSTWNTGNLQASSGTQTVVLVWSGFGTPSNTQTYARIRVSSDASFLNNASPPATGGTVSNGEAEDYLIGAGTTPVTLAAFLAERTTGNRLQVRWSSASEAGTLGYYIAESSPNGGLRDINRELVASRSGSTMAAQDYQTEISSSADELYVVELDVQGNRTVYGPYRVGLSYGGDAKTTPVDWATIQAERARIQTALDMARRSGSGPLDVEARVQTNGLQRITYVDLSAAGAHWDGIPVSRIAISQGRNSVPARIGGGASVGPDTVIEFIGSAVQNSQYTRERVYRISVTSGIPERWAVRDASPQTGRVARMTTREVALDADRYYNFSASGGDPWHFDAVTRTGASAMGRWTLALPADADLSAPAVLNAKLLGAVDFSGSADDHRYRLLVNGTAVAQGSFDGLTPQTRSVPLPPGLLQSSNTVELELQATGYAADRLLVDSLALEFRAPASAQDSASGVLPSAMEFVPDFIMADNYEAAGATPPRECGIGCQPIRIDGFNAPDIVVAQWTAEGMIQLTGGLVKPSAAGYALELQPINTNQGGDGDGGSGEIGMLYAATSASAARPAVRLMSQYPDPLAAGSASYLVIAPAGFEDALAPLIAARQAEGFSTRVVDVQAIYQAYSAGVVDPEAIRSYLRDAHRLLGTRYVLLAGGDTYDYFNRLNLGSVSLIPTFYRATHPVVFFAPADNVYADVDDDGLPELALGRLPARTQAELAAMVGKTLAFATAGHQDSAVFAAERLNPSEAVNYGAISDALIGVLDPEYATSVSKVYLDQYPTGAAGAAQARVALMSAVNSGRALVSYFGHAAPSAWSRERLLQPGDLNAGLANIGKPVVVSEYGCWGGYFVEPSYNTLGLAWLTPGNRGAAAMIAGSSLTFTESDRALALQLVPAMTAPGVRLGDALNFAKTSLWQRAPESVDVLIGMTLLGDPALKLNQNNP